MALSSLRTGGGGTAFLLRRVLSPRSVSEQNLSSSSSSENKPEIKNSLQLYKHLVRQTQKLPPDAANFYKDSIRRGYSQHTEETDPERLKQIYSRAVEDADWVVKKVLALYRRLIRLGHNWEARNPQDTPVERAYILEETRRLFRENAGAASEDRVADHIREAEARVTMAEHYRNPYPRPVNLPQRSFAIRQKKEGQRGVGKAVKKFQDMSKPIYLKSIDDTKKEDK